ncbi:MAG TPA: AAA family ATPase [Rhizomicrobium sp.]|nr:AAA family ATPase [Rhizomicrobium sp.]
MSEESASREVAAAVMKLMTVLRPESEAGRKLSAWARASQALLGVRYEKLVKPAGRARRNAEAPLTRAAWERLRRGLGARVKNARAGRFAQNAMLLAEALRLTDVEARLFAALAAIAHDGSLEELCEQIAATRALGGEEIVATCAGVDRAEALAALGHGTLVSLGLVAGTDGRPGHFDLYVPYDIVRALRGARDLADIETALLGPPAASPLTLADFGHVGAERDFARDLLRGAVARSARGVNVLLYGPPGGGKTELAKVLAREAGSRLFAVRDSDSYGDELNRHDRFAALKLGERLLARRGPAVLLFDEMEDIQQSGEVSFSAGRRIRRAGSKAHFNRFLEGNAVPIVWTANALEEFDPAFLRRMSFAFEMKAPPASARARLWLKAASEHGLVLDEARANALARRYPAVPALAQSASAAVALAHGDGGAIDFVASRMSRAVYGAARTDARGLSSCDVSLLNADCDLQLLERNAAAMPRNVSFCFHGPSGTGKSLYARTLAARLDLEVLEKRGSDFLSKWVGEGEKRVAAAFDEAARDGRFLVIDEAESLFWARGGAERSWEVSLVNEFLVALEHHAWPVAITTNHLERIDPAALRRFTFKVKLDAMTPAQASRAFQSYFALPPPPALAEVTGLTPGDFAVVKKQLDCLGTATPAAIADMLEREVRAKSAGGRRMGF